MEFREFAIRIPSGDVRVSQRSWGARRAQQRLAAIPPRKEPNALRSARTDPCGGCRVTGNHYRDSANRPVERKLQIYGELPHVLPRGGFTRPVAPARRGPVGAEQGL